MDKFLVGGHEKFKFALRDYRRMSAATVYKMKIRFSKYLWPGLKSVKDFKNQECEC